jgi:AcrR family transcriptional regulator
MNDVKKKILDVSRDLFISQGYKETTTRQIIQKAEILNGSLYHFFKNKEDIFKHIIVDVNNEVIELSKSLAEKYHDPILLIAFPDALQFYAFGKHARLAELFLEAYSAWPILDIFTKIESNFMQEFCYHYNPEFSEQDYYLRALSLMGSRRILIAESLFEGNIGYQDKLAVVLEMTQLLYNIPTFDIKATINKTEGILNTEKMVIYGVGV